MNTSWADFLLSFYKGLRPPAQLPNGIEWLYPQKDPGVLKIVEQFLHKYYDDNRERRLFLGINPGRFGAGVTGVNFTAPRQLRNYCGIEHPFRDQTELSAEFIYDMILAYGGVREFYQDFFIGSVCPLGFVKQGRNINYYDDPALAEKVRPFIVRSIQRQVSFRVNREVCYCIGGEKNFKYLSALNEQYHWFTKIEPLPHPRFIMQYRRGRKGEFISQYLETIRGVNGEW